MKGKIISDWSKVNFADPKNRAQVMGALTYFMRAPAREDVKSMPKKVQGYASAGDFATNINQIIEKFHLSTQYDNGYEEIFDIRDFTGTNQSGFDILDVEDGLTFSKVYPGGKAKIYKMAGSKTSISFDLYGGGLGWLRTLIDDAQYWTLEDNAIAFRNKWYADKAEVHYDLIEAVASTYNVSWQTSGDGLASGTATYKASRDIATMNYAANQILGYVKDYGWGVTPQNAQFVVLTPDSLSDRIQAALNLRLQAFADSVSQTHYKFKVIPTLMLDSSTYYYVILPKFKIKGGNRMDLSIFSRFDEESYSDIAVGWGRYGAAIGDIKQIARCAVS